jgi:hypothetical protein
MVQDVRLLVSFDCRVRVHILALAGEGADNSQLQSHVTSRPE